MQQTPTLAVINEEQISLIDQLDQRQDDIIRQLDELSLRIEQIIELYVQNREFPGEGQGSESVDRAA